MFASPTVGVLIVSQLLKDAGVASHAAAADAAAAAGGALHGIPVQHKGCMCVAHRASRCCYYRVLHPQHLMQVGSPCVWCRRWRNRCSRRVFDRPGHRCSARLTPLLFSPFVFIHRSKCVQFLVEIKRQCHCSYALQLHLVEPIQVQKSLTSVLLTSQHQRQQQLQLAHHSRKITRWLEPMRKRAGNEFTLLNAENV